MANQPNRTPSRRPSGQRSQNSRTTNNRPANRRPSQNRNNRNNQNNSLYTGIGLAFVALVLLVCIIAVSAGSCSNGSRRRDYDDDSSMESNISSVSSSVSSENEESSNVPSQPDESSKPSDESSKNDDPVIPPPVNGSAEATQKYEEYIGIEYAIDMTEYEKYVCPENEKDFVFLVNPQNPLSSTFVPEDLVWCTNIRPGRPKEWSYMDATANKALEAFLAEAAYYGFDDITVTNAYRSYASQSSLFNGYVDADIKQDYVCDECDLYIDYSYYPNKVGERCVDCNSVLTKSGSNYHCEICDVDVASENHYTACSHCGATVRRPTRAETEAHVLTYSTRPGTSEHQSGLCCDMHNLPSTTSAFNNTPEAIWLAQNAHRFGFILRYPPDTQDVTGIKHESWHFRYVGRTAATEIYEMQEKLGLDRMYTLDEYVNNK